MKVGVDPILIQMGVPADDSNVWNEEFENGKVLLFATTSKRETVRHIWEELLNQVPRLIEWVGKILKAFAVTVSPSRQSHSGGYANESDRVV
ncbi:hypothetical protein BH23ACT11_BH23ACT11_30280 [soil metagenome]